MISKQELLDSQDTESLEIAGHRVDWLAHQQHLLLYAIDIDSEQLLVIITVRDDTSVLLLGAAEEGILVDDHIQNVLDLVRHELCSPEGVTWICFKNERAVSIERPLGIEVCPC